MNEALIWKSLRFLCFYLQVDPYKHSISLVVIKVLWTKDIAIIFNAMKLEWAFIIFLCKLKLHDVYFILEI